MADDQQTGGQAPAETQPQAGNAPAAAAAEHQTTPSQTTTSTPNTQPQAGQQEHSGDTKDNTTSKPNDDFAARLERMEKALKDANAEAAKYRTKAKELDKLREDEETAKLSEVEKERKLREKAEQVLTTTRERIGKSELKLAAKEAGIIDPDDALAHLMAKLTYDADGEPENVADLVKGLKQSKPHLFGDGQPTQQHPSASKPTTAGGATNPTRQSGPIAITADQYLDPKYLSEFRAKYGQDLRSALRTGTAKII